MHFAQHFAQDAQSTFNHCQSFMILESVNDIFFIKNHVHSLNAFFDQHDSYGFEHELPEHKKHF